MTSPRSWTVVIFEAEQTVQAVPTKWIIGDQCLWPTLPQDKLNVALKNCDYNTCWPSHKIRILRNSTFGDYSLARRKARKAEFTSDLSTDTEAAGHRKRKKKLFSSSDSDSDEDSSNKNKKNSLHSLPPPPSSHKQCSLEKPNEEVIYIDNTTPTTSHRSPVNRTIVERSSTSCRKLCGVCCNKSYQEGKSLYIINSLLAELNGKMDRLLKGDVREAVQETGILVKANIDFPISTVPILQNINQFLEQQENYSELVKYFSKIGGNNLTEFVKRCLAPLVNDELAIQFTYLGRRGKLNFGASNLAKAIVDAAEKTSLVSNRKETELSIGAWLRRAPERIRRCSATPI